MAAATASLDTLCVNSIRMLAVDAVNKSNSGHPGLPMGCAPMGYALWDKFLKHNPKNPKWFNRDRFVLSAGHGCMLQYALLHHRLRLGHHRRHQAIPAVGLENTRPPGNI